MNIRNTDKVVEVQGREYVIRKFSPQIGCFWAFRLLGNMASLGDGNLEDKIKNFLMMERKEFEQLQKDCLSHVFARMESGTHALINREGFIVIPDLGTPVVFQLTLQAFLYTIADFFDGAQLEEMGKGLAEMFPAELGATSQEIGQSDFSSSL